jgi:hypothetical protein
MIVMFGMDAVVCTKKSGAAEGSISPPHQWRDFIEHFY